jgi:hypothetical protein
VGAGLGVCVTAGGDIVVISPDGRIAKVRGGLGAC